MPQWSSNILLYVALAEPSSSMTLKTSCAPKTFEMKTSPDISQTLGITRDDYVTNDVIHYDVTDLVIPKKNLVSTLHANIQLEEVCKYYRLIQS